MKRVRTSGNPYRQSTAFRDLLLVSKGHNRPLQKMESLEYFSNFPNFPNSHVPKLCNGQAPRGRCLSVSKFWKVWQVGKFGKLESLESWKVWKTCSCCCNPFGQQYCLWCTPGETKDDRSAQAVQDEAYLTLAATRAGFSTAPRP